MTSEGQEHSVPALVAAFPCLAPGLLLLDPADRFKCLEHICTSGKTLLGSLRSSYLMFPLRAAALFWFKSPSLVSIWMSKHGPSGPCPLSCCVAEVNSA